MVLKKKIMDVFVFNKRNKGTRPILLWIINIIKISQNFPIIGGMDWNQLNFS